MIRFGKWMIAAAAIALAAGCAAGGGGARPFAEGGAAEQRVTIDMYYPADIETHWAYDELDNFVNADMLRGYVDAEGIVTLRPDSPISRAEFVAILVRSLGAASEGAGKTFVDVQPGSWYYEPIRIASALDIADGISATQFAPDQPITRGEIAKLVVRAFSGTVSFEGESIAFADVPEYFATESIVQASRAGIVRGVTETEFRPFAKAKRAEAVVMLQRALDLQAANLPGDETLANVVLESERRQFEAYKDEARNYGRLYDVNAEFYTGYYLSYSDSVADEIVSLTSEGYQIEMTQTGTPSVQVVAKSDRFAVAEATGGRYAYRIYLGEDEAAGEKAVEGLFYLKKMPDQSWKIYAYYPYD